MFEDPTFNPELPVRFDFNQPVSYGLGSMTPNAGFDSNAVLQALTGPQATAGQPENLLIDILRMASNRERQGLELPTPRDVSPALRTPDAVAVGMAALTALLGGRKGGDAATSILNGWVQGKLGKAQQDTEYNLREHQRQQQLAAHDANTLRQQAYVQQQLEAQQNQSRSKYLDLTKALLGDLDRMSSGNASAFIGRLRILADKAGVPELAPSQDEEGQIVAGMMAGENRNLAAKMIPGLLATMRSNGVPGARVTAGMLLLGLGKRHPDLLQTFDIDPVGVAQALAELSPRETREQAGATKISAETETIDALRDQRVKKATADAEIAVTRNRFLQPMLTKTLEAKELAVDRAKQSMALADERFNLASIKDKRQAMKMVSDSVKDLPKLKDLKKFLEVEFRQLNDRRKSIQEGSFKLPQDMNRSEALQSIQIAMDKNAAKRSGIDAQAKALTRNRALLEEFLRRMPRASTRVRNATIDKRGGAGALVIPPMKVEVDPRLPGADVRKQVPSNVYYGSQDMEPKPAASQRSPVPPKSPQFIENERRLASLAIAKYKGPNQSAQRQAIKDEFYRRTGVKL